MFDLRLVENVTHSLKFLQNCSACFLQFMQIIPLDEIKVI